MRYAKWRFFINHEKEEAWLNGMSAKGLALTGFFFGRYTFEDSEPGGYVYRIELLDKSPSGPEGQRYLRFMEENGVECVSSWFRWAYFRKRAGGGGFDIYSDPGSQLAHYRRISTLWLVIVSVAVLNMANMLAQVCLGNWGLWPLNAVLCAFFACICVAVLSNWNSMRKKMRALKREMALRG
ncbi:MAG: DUF2812 domain-containing protein [Methanomassiliicoccaceae archaeon]|nr:DUF2812 domain-containing protein [Methanomassiliicoccaceae archaeon]